MNNHNCQTTLYPEILVLVSQVAICHNPTRKTEKINFINPIAHGGAIQPDIFFEHLSWSNGSSKGYVLTFPIYMLTKNWTIFFQIFLGGTPNMATHDCI